MLASFLPARHGLFLLLLSAGLLLLPPAEAWGQKKRYQKATEDDDEVVKNKLFAKKGKIELAGPDLGLILNQAYVNSYILHGNLNYYWSESWGLSLEGLFTFNEDKSERFCIENFYNDPNQEVSMSCPHLGQAVDEPLIDHYKADDSPKYKAKANFGPAYVSIREINAIVTGTGVWSPVYGKQLAFLSNTVYFDLFFSFGGGITQSTYYPKSIFLRNAKLARPQGVPQEELDNLIVCNEDKLQGGVCPENKDVNELIGINGRPDPEEHISPTLTFGIGQKFHFKKRFNFKAEIRNYTLVGTDRGFDSFFMLWAGFGLRL